MTHHPDSDRQKLPAPDLDKANSGPSAASGYGTRPADAHESPLSKASPSGRWLRTIVVETTLRCDQACAFCGSRAGAQWPGELSSDEFRDLVQQAASLGAEQVELTGGETYLREDWLELVRIARDAGLRCAMITAGRNIDLEKARRAAEAGIHHVSVSIDGPPATHDELRGVTGSFERACHAVGHFREAGIPVACNTQVNARNWQELPRLADLLVGLGLYAWQVQLMIPMGRAAEAERLLLQPFQMLEVVPAIAAIIERCAGEGLTVYAGDNVGYFGPHEATLRGGVNRQAHTVGCLAGALGVGIDPFGDVKGCSSLDGPGEVAGNVRHRALADLWNESPVLRATDEWNADTLWGFCATCYYATVCRGGCASTAIALTGRRGNNPYCHHRALELAKCGQRETLVPTGVVSRGRRGFAVFELRREPVEADGAGLAECSCVK